MRLEASNRQFHLLQDDPGGGSSQQTETDCTAEGWTELRSTTFGKAFEEAAKNEAA